MGTAEPPLLGHKARPLPLLNNPILKRILVWYRLTHYNVINSKYLII